LASGQSSLHVDSNTNNSIKNHDELTTCTQKCHDPPQETISLWNRYVQTYDPDKDDDVDDDLNEEEDDSNLSFRTNATSQY